MLVLDLWSINLYRVHTDFWIQTFTTSFSKTIYFSRLKFIKKVINIDL